VTRKERPQYYRRFWTTGLAVVLFMLSQFLAVGAQTGKSPITTTAADSTFEPTLSQPVEFLEVLGLTQEEVQQQIKPRPRILVEGAGSVKYVGLASFANLKNDEPTGADIQVSAAGSVRIVRVMAFTELSNTEPSASV